MDPKVRGWNRVEAKTINQTAKSRERSDREGGYEIRTVQELLGHKDVSSTMIYTHVLNKGGHGVRSPIDGP
jgi:site-specific recombinase XerC